MGWWIALAAVLGAAAVAGLVLWFIYRQVRLVEQDLKHPGDNK